MHMVKVCLSQLMMRRVKYFVSKMTIVNRTIASSYSGDLKFIQTLASGSRRGIGQGMNTCVGGNWDVKYHQ